MNIAERTYTLRKGAIELMTSPICSFSDLILEGIDKALHWMHSVITHMYPIFQLVMLIIYMTYQLSIRASKSHRSCLFRLYISPMLRKIIQIVDSGIIALLDFVLIVWIAWRKSWAIILRRPTYLRIDSEREGQGEEENTRKSEGKEKRWKGGNETSNMNENGGKERRERGW